ncbi:MAG: protein-L-isoaspartate(D-aspartate) O-methyltransferase [Micavibrio aeruginosavorus]|nr:protein-L-isoaspartate(D-aspartate) O-methyltransferase [Micavibrio aeruginosavorus]
MDTNTKRVLRLIMHLRKMGITDTKVLAAIERVPREIFIPRQMHDQAYEDIALPIGRGQTISQPFIVAIMTQALELNDRHKVLEIGTGSGYQACVLAWICRRVYTIERHKPLLERAEEIFRYLNIRDLHNITTKHGDGMRGWPEQAPFDRIIVTAAAQGAPPQALLDQLAIGGIMIVPVAKDGKQVLRRYKKEGEDTFAVKDLLDVRFVPLLPNLARTTEEADDPVPGKSHGR